MESRYKVEEFLNMCMDYTKIKLLDTQKNIIIDEITIRLSDHNNSEYYKQSIQVATDEMMVRCNELNMSNIDLNFNQNKKVVDDFLNKFDRENLENSDKKLIDDFIENDYYGKKDDPYEAIKIINNLNLNFNRGNVLKYILRAGKKYEDKEIEDLIKAKNYIDYEIERLKIMNKH